MNFIQLTVRKWNILAAAAAAELIATLTQTKAMHYKCRNGAYSHSNILRSRVADEQVPWDVKLDDYSPPDYTASSVEGKAWADSAKLDSCKFNMPNDDGVMRTSFHGKYKLDSDGRPINPFGRTGMRGRGLLGKWGPNHAADAIVSRQTTQNGQLEFVAVERRDTGELAIPGGMLDKGESAEHAVVREFIEEALGGKSIEKLEEFWKKGTPIYQGYVDDPRNTDNAWIETTCVNFHDTDGLFDDIQLEAGDDAKTAHWVAVSEKLKLYASHEQLIRLFAKAHGIGLDRLDV